MSLPTIPLPYGLRDVRIVPYTLPSALVLGTPVDFPNARTLGFSEAEDFDELRGDDAVVTTRGRGAAVDWTLEGGGYSFEAVKAMYGGTVVLSGVTPNQVKTFRKNKDDSRPFFLAEGQSISDSGGDFHTVLFRCRATGPMAGTQGDGVFWLTGASGRALPGYDITAPPDNYEVGDIYHMVQNETATPIP